MELFIKRKDEEKLILSDDQDVSDISLSVVKFVDCFTDRVCRECGVFLLLVVYIRFL